MVNMPLEKLLDTTTTGQNSATVAYNVNGTPLFVKCKMSDTQSPVALSIPHEGWGMNNTWYTEVAQEY